MITHIQQLKAKANDWWMGLNETHQAELIRILQLDVEPFSDPPMPKTLELIRAWRQCPNKEYRDVK